MTHERLIRFIDCLRFGISFRFTLHKGVHSESVVNNWYQFETLPKSLDARSRKTIRDMEMSRDIATTLLKVYIRTHILCV